MGARVELQRALYVALSEIAGPLGVPVYDYVPPGTEYPYITIGRDNVTDYGYSCGGISEIDSEIQVWTGEPHRGHIYTKSLLDTIENQLSDVLPSVEIDDYLILSAEFVDSFIDRDGDGLTYVGSINYRFYIEAI